MEATNLIQKLGVYGADMNGINDRFMGDAELYEKCFLNFLQEENFEKLDRAIRERDCAAAFEAAHALKGLSGNLGLTPFYETICTLVESLRAGDMRNIDAEHREVQSALGWLRAVLIGNDVPSPTVMTVKRATTRKPKRRVNRFMLTLAGGLLLIVGVVTLLFLQLSHSYEDQIDIESAHHLTEICYQVKLYVEERINSDWNVAYTVANSIERAAHVDPDRTLMPYMESLREIWHVSEIFVLTESGYGIRTDGRVVENSVALEAIYQAQMQGEYLSIIESELTYTVPVETDKTLRDSRIAAVCIVQDVGSFLDEMNFSSFGGEAYLFLTQQNGAVVSSLTHPGAMDTYNFMSLLEGKTLVTLSDEMEHAERDMLLSEAPVTHLLQSGGEEEYVVSTPVAAHEISLRLFYVVPERVVNRTLDRFSTNLTTMSALTVTAFSVLALALFLYIFNVRKRRFNEELQSRERMFDLLTQNSNATFALLSTNSDEPLYVSGNAERIIGRRFLVLEKNEGVYSMRNDLSAWSLSLDQINDEMREWDGLTPFHSGYIKNPTSADARYYSFELYPVNDSGTEYAGIAQDVTSQHDHEETVKTALAMAEQSNAAKTHFLSNMSHDIRTPLNAIVNMTDFALESVGEARKQVKYLQTIRESSDHLLRLINDVLDMSRIESGQAVISAEAFGLKAELTRIEGIVRPLCEAKKQTFLANLDALETDYVLGDRLKISQVLLNLLGNSVKFTPDRGAIRFTVMDLPSPHHNYAAVRFVIEDNGIGISEENIQRIFDPFMRVDDARVGEVEGTGLGLPIVKSYIAAMGGKVSCESEPENGSKFTVELPLERAQAEADGAERARRTAGAYGEPFSGRHCLLCEDNETNLVIASTVLEKVGFMVDVAANGGVGLEKFLASRPGYYDIIYMDIRMPVMDGYQAAVAIRGSAHPQALSIPIVALTANVFAEDIEKARIAGMNGYLGKPLMVLELIDETSRVLRREEQGT